MVPTSVCACACACACGWAWRACPFPVLAGRCPCDVDAEVETAVAVVVAVVEPMVCVVWVGGGDIAMVRAMPVTLRPSLYIPLRPPDALLGCFAVKGGSVADVSVEIMGAVMGAWSPIIRRACASLSARSSTTRFDASSTVAMTPRSRSRRPSAMPSVSSSSSSLARRKRFSAWLQGGVLKHGVEVRQL